MSLNFTHIVLFHLQGSKVASGAWDNYTFLTKISPCASSPPARNPCGENNGGCAQVCVLSHRTDNGGLGYRCKCTFGFNLDVDGRHCVGKKSGLECLSARWHRGICCSWTVRAPSQTFSLFCSPQGIFLSRPHSPVHRAVFKEVNFCPWGLPLSPQLGFPGLPFPLGSSWNHCLPFKLGHWNFIGFHFECFFTMYTFFTWDVSLNLHGDHSHHFYSPLSGCHLCHFESGNHILVPPGIIGVAHFLI